MAALPLQAQMLPWVDLSGEWRTTTPDKPEFSRPDFDDSAWGPVQLPLTERPPKGVRWYRRTASIPADADRTQLAITI